MGNTEGTTEGAVIVDQVGPEVLDVQDIADCSAIPVSDGRFAG